MPTSDTPLYEVFGTAEDTDAPYLAVRADHNASAEQVDSLIDGTLVIKDAQAESGEWWQVSNPVGPITGSGGWAEFAPDAVSFNSGWVNSRFLILSDFVVDPTGETGDTGAVAGSISTSRLDAFQQILLGGTLQRSVAPCAAIPGTATAAAEDAETSDGSDAAADADATSDVADAVSAEDLPGGPETATLYIDTSGTPDVPRFIAETAAIAERRAQDALQDYPLPEDRLFVILAGNGSGSFKIENESEGSIEFGTSLVDAADTPETSNKQVEHDLDEVNYVGDTEGSSTSRGSSLIESLAKVCAAPPISDDAPPPGTEGLFEVANTTDGELNLRETAGADPLGTLIIAMPDGTRLRKLGQTESGSWYNVEVAGGDADGTQGWANASYIAQVPAEGGDETPAPEPESDEEPIEEGDAATPSETETTDEIAELVTPSSEFAAQNPEIAATLETIRSSPTSTHTLLIGIVLSDSSDSQGSKKGTAKEYLSKFNTEEIGLEMLSGSGLDTAVTDATETGGGLETLESLAYKLNINIADATVNPEDQLPTATATTAGCGPTSVSAALSGSVSGSVTGSTGPLNIVIPAFTGVRSGRRRVTGLSPTNNGHGYDNTSLRNDVADRFEGLRDDLLSRGAILTSAGGLRGLSADVTVGRANLSLHYLGLAHDLATRSGVSNPFDPDENPYLVEREDTGRTHSNDKPRYRWHIWARATGGSERTLQVLHDRRGRGGEIVEVTARVVSLTDLAASNGIDTIGNRSCYPDTYGCMEWWHLQCPDLIGDLKFGPLLQQVRDDDEISQSRLAQERYFNAEWTGGYFRAA